MWDLMDGEKGCGEGDGKVFLERVVEFYGLGEVERERRDVGRIGK